MKSFAAMGAKPVVGQLVKVVEVNLTLNKRLPRQFIITRKLGASGIVKEPVPATEEAIWFVEYDNGVVAAYHLGEIAPDGEALAAD
jgi:hypothetical protein